MATLTETGIVIESFDAILSKLEQGFRAIYGQNINLNADTPDGQMIGLLAQMRMDFEELAQTVYNQLDPDAATGAWLEQRVAYAGLMRRSFALASRIPSFMQVLWYPIRIKPDGCWCRMFSLIATVRQEPILEVNNWVRII